MLADEHVWVPEQPLKPFWGCTLRKVSTEHKFLTDIIIFIAECWPNYHGRESMSMRDCLSLEDFEAWKTTSALLINFIRWQFPSGYTPSASANSEATVAQKLVRTRMGPHISSKANWIKSVFPNTGVNPTSLLRPQCSANLFKHPHYLLTLEPKMSVQVQFPTCLIHLKVTVTYNHICA